MRWTRGQWLMAATLLGACTDSSVGPRLVATVSVTAPFDTVFVGGTVQLTATMKDSAGNVLTDRTVTWTSGNSGIASVSDSGLVTGVAGGKVTIRATSEGHSDSAMISVLTAPDDHQWTPFSGLWEITNGWLSTQAVGGVENWIWAGAAPIVTRGDLDADLTIEFANAPGGEIGRHGGIMFYAAVPTTRWDRANTGYTIDWIDRVDDHGFRLWRWEGGGAVLLAIGGASLADPLRFWQVRVHADTIRFYADEQPILEVTDGTYREGRFGVWAVGNGTHILVDDVRIGTAFHDSFTRATP